MCPGAEHASITVRTNIQVAQTQVEEAQKLSVDANKKLAEAKVMEVERMAQYAASLQNNNDEEEVPEAYLREDWNEHLEVLLRKENMKNVGFFLSLLVFFESVICLILICLIQNATFKFISLHLR